VISPMCTAWRLATVAEHNEGNAGTMNVKKLAIPALCIGLLGVVGGVAAANAFHPAEKAQPQVQFVQPASEVVTPTVEVTTATPTATVAPKPVVKKAPAPAPVESAQAPAPAPQVQQKAAVVSEPTPEATTPQATTPAATPEVAPDDPIRNTPPPPIMPNLPPPPSSE